MSRASRVGKSWMGNIYIGKKIFDKIISFLYDLNYEDKESSRLETLAEEVKTKYYLELVKKRQHKDVGDQKDDNNGEIEENDGEFEEEEEEDQDFQE